MKDLPVAGVMSLAYKGRRMGRQVVVLLGTGWSYMKPLLNDREKRILMIVIPLQVGRKLPHGLLMSRASVQLSK